MRKLLITSIFLGMTATASLAAEYGELAGTYSGKTTTGDDVTIVLPKSGSPSYRFKGTPTMVASPKIAGKTITMNVGKNGMGKVTLVVSGNTMSYRWQGGQNTATGTLSKQ